MNRVSDLTLRRVTVAIVLLCLSALTLCQVLGPTARLHHAFAPADLSGEAYVGATIRTAGAHNTLPARCAAIKLAPIDLEITSFTPEVVACDLPGALASIPPQSAEIGVPTPPPRSV